MTTATNKHIEEMAYNSGKHVDIKDDQIVVKFFRRHAALAASPAYLAEVTKVFSGENMNNEAYEFLYKS